MNVFCIIHITILYKYSNYLLYRNVRIKYKSNICKGVVRRLDKYLYCFKILWEEGEAHRSRGGSQKGARESPRCSFKSLAGTKSLSKLCHQTHRHYFYQADFVQVVPNWSQRLSYGGRQPPVKEPNRSCQWWRHREYSVGRLLAIYTNWIISQGPVIVKTASQERLWDYWVSGLCRVTFFIIARCVVLFSCGMRILFPDFLRPSTTIIFIKIFVWPAPASSHCSNCSTNYCGSMWQLM